MGSALASVDIAVMPIGPSLLEVDRLGPTLELAAEVGCQAVALLVRTRRTRLAVEDPAAAAESADARIAADHQLRHSAATGTRACPCS